MAATDTLRSIETFNGERDPACLPLPLPSPRGSVRPLRDPLARGHRRAVGRVPLTRPFRAEIDESWHRALVRGLRSDSVEPGIEPLREEATPLERAADEVMPTLGEDLAGTNMSVLVADPGGRIVRRCAAGRAAAVDLDHLGVAPGFVWSEDHVGTNGIGTALHGGTAIVVVGDEHFSDRLTTRCSAGVPIRDDRDRIVGVVAIIGRIEDTNGLMLSVARQAARDLRRCVLAQPTTRRDLVRDGFARARRHTRGALAGVSPDVIVMNAAAAVVLTVDDRVTLWEWASAGRTATPIPPVILTSGLALDASSAPILDGPQMVGALVSFSGAACDAWPLGSSRTSPSAARFGWSSLTAAEIGIAEQVAAGRTNRAVAAQLFLSPHTVDSHLRHIYTKLGIGSRVQLTRLVMANEQPRT
jgi:sigma-54 dependent transcriptional regulator, acetoin dehydrogenase operon transcriptional activator AcoR